MNKRRIGNVLMIAGFVYALGTMMFMPEAKEASMLGFAMIGCGCAMGLNNKPKTKNQPKINKTKKNK